jgi:uncharacterized membrane protein
MEKKHWPMLILLATVVMSIVSYPGLPDTIAIHFGPTGEPDGFSSKLSALIIMPVLMLFMNILFRYTASLGLPKESFARSEPALQVIYTTVMLTLGIIQGLIIAFGYGYQINTSMVITILMSILFIASGNYLPTLPQNYMIGIRTPWTLSSEAVWRKTHHFCSRLFVIVGLIMLVLTFVLPSNLLFLVIIGGALIIVVASIASSYHFYKNSK